MINFLKHLKYFSSSFTGGLKGCGAVKTVKIIPAKNQGHRHVDTNTFANNSSSNRASPSTFALLEGIYAGDRTALAKGITLGI
jgi:hypothetical protein